MTTTMHDSARVRANPPAPGVAVLARGAAPVRLYVVFLLLLVSSVAWRRGAFFSGGVDGVVVAKAGLTMLAFAVALLSRRPRDAWSSVRGAPLLLLVAYLSVATVGGLLVGDPLPSFVLAARAGLLGRRSCSSWSATGGTRSSPRWPARCCSSRCSAPSPGWAPSARRAGSTAGSRPSTPTRSASWSACPSCSPSGAARPSTGTGWTTPRSPCSWASSGSPAPAPAWPRSSSGCWSCSPSPLGCRPSSQACAPARSPCCSTSPSSRPSCRRSRAAGAARA